MDIWTEKLEHRHLQLLEHWFGRVGGKMTANDLPDSPNLVQQWYDSCMAEPERLDCLVLAYETPIGIAGFQRIDGIPDEAEFYLMLGESNYNLIRTATYATIRILDRSFEDHSRMTARVYERHSEYLSVLMRMGFSQTVAEGGIITVMAEKSVFQSQKYLF